MTMRWRARGRITCLVVLAACGGASEPPVVAPTSTTTSTNVAAPQAAVSADAVVARIGADTVTASRLDEAIRLPLHDLEHARFELRARRLDEIVRGRVLGPAAAAEGVSIEEYVRRHAGPEGPDAFVAAALAQAGVEVLLEEPEPPVLDVSVDDDAVRGRPDAPVTVLAFVDLQSSYCARMQPVFAQLLARYPEHVRLVVRDLPLPVHRDAVRAAEAAECAGEQGAYWAFYDRVLQAQDDLGPEALARHAANAGVDVARFSACVESRATQAEVEADAAAARALGVSVVPTLFVNGRYLRGPVPYDVLAARVEAELRALGIAVPPPPAPTDAPARPDTSATPESGATTATAPPSGAAAPMPLTLRAADVEAALRQRGRLARDLEGVSGDFGPGYEGRKLVRVRTVRPGSLWDQMGLRDGDVVVLVNGALMLDDGAALLDALRDRAQVTVQLLRRGLPVTYVYAIE
jgi:protein-disulfide isomerase